MLLVVAGYEAGRVDCRVAVGCCMTKSRLINVSEIHTALQTRKNAFPSGRLRLFDVALTQPIPGSLVEQVLRYV